MLDRLPGIRAKLLGSAKVLGEGPLEDELWMLAEIERLRAERTVFKRIVELLPGGDAELAIEARYLPDEYDLGERCPSGWRCLRIRPYTLDAEARAADIAAHYRMKALVRHEPIAKED